VNRTKREQVAQVAIVVQHKAVVYGQNGRLRCSRFLHIEDVSGSNPLSPTIIRKSTASAVLFHFAVEWPEVAFVPLAPAATIR